MDSNLRNIIPEVCANCENKRWVTPVWTVQHYYCDVEHTHESRLFIPADEQHYKTCDKFSVKLGDKNEH